MDFLPTKGLEYLLVLGYLLLLIPFWTLFFGEAARARLVAAQAWAGQVADWFRIPERVFLHPGHGWARYEAPGVMTVGLDDFAQQLVGPLAAIALPQPGTPLKVGTRAWAIRADGKSVDMLAPVSGTVMAVNGDLRHHAALANEDPYGRGWLMKVQVPRMASAVQGLVSGAAARKWMDEVSHQLTASMTPELGHLCQDGGFPVQGIARAIDDAHWDEVAGRFLLTGPEA